MPMSRSELCARIPHAGDMCLLGSLEEWDEQVIVCRAHSHRDAANPLRSRDRLAAVCGVEYAGQAIALHGGLVAARQGAAPRVGYFASLRDIRLHTERLDDIDAELSIRANRLSGDDNGYLYQFEVSVEGVPLVTGRAAVMLRGEAPK